MIGLMYANMIHQVATTDLANLRIKKFSSLIHSKYHTYYYIESKMINHIMKCWNHIMTRFQDFTMQDSRFLFLNVFKTSTNPLGGVLSGAP